MKLNEKEIEQIIVADSEGTVLAVISDNEIIEKDGVSVIVGEKLT